MSGSGFTPDLLDTWIGHFDLGRIGNPGQIHAPIAFAQRRPELIEPRQLGIAELDFEAGGAFDQGAHGELSKPGRIIRII